MLGHQVKKILIHEGYNAKTSENDIAIMTLEKPLNFFDTDIENIELNDYDPKSLFFASI